MGGPRVLPRERLRQRLPAQGGAPQGLFRGRHGAERGPAALWPRRTGHVQRGAPRLLEPPGVVPGRPALGGLPAARGSPAGALGRHGRQRHGRHLLGGLAAGGPRWPPGHLGQLEPPVPARRRRLRPPHPPGAAPARRRRHRPQRRRALLLLVSPRGHLGTA